MIAKLQLIPTETDENAANIDDDDLAQEKDAAMLLLYCIKRSALFSSFSFALFSYFFVIYTPL